MEILNKKEKAEFEAKLKEHYGIEKLNFLLMKSGLDKIRGFTGNLSSEEIKLLKREINLEIVGSYLAKEEKDGIRLSFDAPNLLKPEKNIVEINNEQAHEWLKGRDIEYSGEKGFVIIKNKEDFLGCGKSSNNRITNFVPKERRIKN